MTIRNHAGQYANQTIPQPRIDQVLRAVAAEDPITLRISGCCMAPTLKDKVQVRIGQQGRYWIGDLLVVRLSNGQLVSHRLIGIYPRGKQLRFMTRADHADRPDASITREQILGKIISEANGVPVSSPFHRLKALWKFIAFSGARLVKIMCHSVILRTARKLSSVTFAALREQYHI